MTHSVAIIGAGFSGSLTALNLLASSPRTSVTLIDSRGTFGPGLAYTVPSDRFKLNVRAKAMGAFPNDPEGFSRWLKEREPFVSPDAFVSRRWYGIYLQELVREKASFHPDALRLVHGEATTLERIPGRTAFRITLADSSLIDADTVVLAIGNLMRRSVGAQSALGVLRAPYDPVSYQDVAQRESILILGSSLTAVDVILECEGRGFLGHYSVISRNGRFPLPHEDAAGLPQASLPPGWENPGTALNLLRTLRTESRRCGSSQPVFDAMRPRIQQMWQGLSLDQKRAFLRHARPFWEIHRHRIPAEHLSSIEKLRAAKRLAIMAGRIERVSPNEALVSRRKSPGPPERIPFDLGFLCAGPEGDLARIDHPLLKNLLSQQLVQPGPLGLGIGAAARATVPGLYVIGPLQRETLWEITAVRELRDEAQRVAHSIVSAST